MGQFSNTGIIGRRDFRRKGIPSLNFGHVFHRSHLLSSNIFSRYLLYAGQCAGLWAHEVIKIRLMAFTTLGCNCGKCNEVESYIVVSQRIVKDLGLREALESFPEDVM